jgi:AraC-like DNA-binding protein
MPALPQASFDSWTIVFLNFSFVGFIISFFLFFKKSPQLKANRIMAVYTLLFAVCMIEYVLYWTRYLFYFPAWADVSGGFPLLWGPLLYFYFKVVYDKHEFKKSDLVHLIPFVAYTLYKLPYYFADAELKMNPFKIDAYEGHEFFFTILPWIRILFQCLYGFVIYRYLKQQGNLSDTKKWSAYLFAFYILFIMTSVAYYWLINYRWFNADWDYFISFVMSASIISTAWFAYSSPSIFNGYKIKESLFQVQYSAVQYKYIKAKEPAKPVDEQQVIHSYKVNPSLIPSTPQTEEASATKESETEEFIKYKNSGLTESASIEMANEVTALMEKEKLYRENDLRLDTLSDKLGYAKHHVSQVINEQFGMNFFEYINLLRIQEAKKLLIEKSAKELNVIEIAYSVGFNNKVTFNTAFKRITGCTPTAFRNSFAIKSK